MTTITDSMRTVAGDPDNEQVVFFVPETRPTASGTATVTMKRVPITPVNGDFSVTLDPGLVYAQIGSSRSPFVVPASGTARMGTLIAQYLPPTTTPTQVDAAITAWLEDNPLPGGGLTVDQIATAATTSTPLKTALDASYVPIDDPRLDVVASGGATTIATGVGTDGWPKLIISTPGTVVPTPPGAPTALAATPAPGEVALTWSAPADAGDEPITDYRVDYKLASSSTWLEFAHTAATTLARTVTGLTNSSAYDFRVAAVSAAGTGDYSATVTSTPVSAAPAQVTGVAVTPGNHTADVSWTAAASSASYVVSHRLVGAGSWTDVADTASPLALTGLTNGAREFRVAGVNSASVQGPWSDTVTVTVGAVNGVVLSDTFTRTATELVGTSPDVGPAAWAGATGKWSVSGTRAVGKGATLSLTTASIGARGDTALTALARWATNETVTKELRFYVKNVDSANGLYLNLRSQSSGVPLLTVSKRIANTATVIATFPGNAIPGSSPAADFPVEISLVGLVVTATVNGVTVTANLSEAEAAALASSSAIAIASDSVNHETDNLSVSVNGLYV